MMAICNLTKFEKSNSIQMNKKLSKLIVGAFALVLAVPNANAQTQLFTNGKENNIDIYWRIPSIVRMNDGALWAFTDKRYYAATDLGAQDGNTPHKIEIYGRKSFDNGKSWNNAEVVLQSNLNASGANEYLFAFGDAATVVDRESGRVLMMAASGTKGVKANPTGQPFVTRSVYDAGKWVTSNVSGQFYGPGNLYGTTLFVTSGRMVQSTKYKKDKYYRIYAGVCLYSKSASYVVYSDDFGETWQYLGGYLTVPVQDGDECKVEELPNGDILLVTRKRSGAAGRYINVFHFTDIANGTGSWQTRVSTGTNQTDGEAYAAANNGEIMLVPAQSKEGKQTYVLLLSVATNNSNRSNVCIYWKELPVDYSDPFNYKSGWTKYQVNNGQYWGYTTMALDQKGDIAFLSELSQYTGPISFISLPLSTITNGAYSYHASAKGTYHTSSEPIFVQQPSLSLGGGVYNTDQTVTINNPDGSTVYYTLDGSDPVVPTTITTETLSPRLASTVTGTQVYSNPITISEGSTTLKAVAVDNYSGNVSQTVSANYLVTSAENTNSANVSKNGTTISLDHANATNLFTNNGTGTFWAYLRHNSTHIQLISSTVSELEPGQQLFHVTNNNMVWGADPNYYLQLYNGKLGGKTVTQYGYYCILAPKGYRFLRYEIDMDKSSENGAKLEEYKYQSGSNTDINVVYSVTASNSQDVKMTRTLSDGTNVLYFRMDGQSASDQNPIVVKSIKLTYAIDDSFTAQVPNENGTKIHSGFIDLGTFSKGENNAYNYGFSNSQATDLETVKVVKTDGSAPQNVTVDGGKYFMATTDGDYYVEAPAKFRIIGATVNFKRSDVNSTERYTPSATSNGDRIIFQANDDTQNYLKIDANGHAVNTNSKDDATAFTITYNAGSGENHYSLQMADGKYLTITSTAIATTNDKVLWALDNNGLKCYNSDLKDYRYLGNNGDGNYGWDLRRMGKSCPHIYRTSIPASDFTATVYNREDNGTAANGEKSLTADAPTQNVTVSDMNNDAVHIKLSGIASGSAALFNVQLQLLPLDPEVSTVEAAAKVGEEVEGNSPVTSYNYVFNNGNIIGVPVPANTNKDAGITMVFRNAKNEEQTLWYSTGNNQNNQSIKGGYSNVYLIGSTADKDNGLNVTSPYPDARTAVDVAGVNEVYATNIAQLADANNTSVNTLQDNTVDATSAGNTTVTMTVNTPTSDKSTDGNTFYLYSADQPTYQIMPKSLAQSKHIDFRFFTIKVKPVVAETPNIEIVPIYTSTMKGKQHKVTNISSDGNDLDKKYTYVGVKVTAVKDASVSTAYNALTAEDIYTALKTKLSSADYANQIYAGDPLRTVLYVDMSSLSTVTIANTTTMGNYKTETADNCLFFMPQGFAATGLANVVSKQSDGSYQAIGDVTVYDQQPFFSPYDFNMGSFKAIYEREGTVNGANTKALVRNMAAVLPFTIQLDGKGHPYLDGNDEANQHITFKTITGFGELTAVRKDSNGQPLTYGVKATDVTDLVASANNPYYVALDEDQQPGFSFNIPGASFAKSGILTTTTNGTTVTPDDLSSTNDTWTSHGTYSGVQPQKANGLWYFSKDLFWNSGLLTNFSNVNVRPFRAYYNGPTSTSAKAAVVYDDSDIVATGITTINGVSTANGKVYDLNGRYVGDSLELLAPGLYIQNGHKVVKQ